MTNHVLLAEAVRVRASGIASSIRKGILTGKDLVFLINKSYGLGFTTSLLMKCLRRKIICHANIKRNRDVIISVLLLLKIILLKHTNFFELGKYKFNIPDYIPGNVFLKITLKYLNRMHIIYS